MTVLNLIRCGLEVDTELAVLDLSVLLEHGRSTHRSAQDALTQLPLLASLDATDATRQNPLARWSRFLTACTDAERASVAEEAPIMRRTSVRHSQRSCDPIQDMLDRKREDDIWLTELGRRRGEEAARAEGYALGYAEGIEKVRAERRAAVLSLLDAKFGTVNDATRALVASADAPTLIRVGIQTASASSLDELDFGPG